MDEYLHELKNQAAMLLAERFGRMPTADESPILKLATALLGEFAEGEAPTLTRGAAPLEPASA